MNAGLDEREWKLLLQRIADGKCTPFLGSGLNEGLLPSRSAIAQSWVSEHGYPMGDQPDLARVANYLAVQYDPLFPKEEIQQQYAAAATPNFSLPNQPHTILANLNLPIYISTTYDGFMTAALKHLKKDPQRELCRWNSELLRTQPSILDTGYQPTPANPLVYHLHGHYETPESLVLTEDDYMDFLVNISSQEHELPPRIQQALSGSSLLFVGYSPLDWDFRVLFRGLVAASESSLRRISVTVQLPPLPTGSSPEMQEKVQKYLSDYFDQADRRMRVYWGTADSFITELNQRWQGIATSAKETAVAQPQIDLMRLQMTLSDSFNLQELQEMVQYELRIDYETFPDTKPPFIMELIVYMQRRGRLYELVDTCQRLRPQKQWS
jgi:hypothetical protein